TDMPRSVCVKVQTISARWWFPIAEETTSIAYLHPLMTSPTNRVVQQRSTPHKRRRIIVVVIPPVEELDLVGPLQVFSSVNRLACQAIYSIEVVTNAKQLKVDGEGGLLTFLAQGHLQDL